MWFGAALVIIVCTYWDYSSRTSNTLVEHVTKSMVTISITVSQFYGTFSSVLLDLNVVTVPALPSNSDFTVLYLSSTTLNSKKEIE